MLEPTEEVVDWWARESLIPFSNPTSIQIVGATQAGKTRFVQRILRNVNGMFDNPPKRIVYAYSQWQPAYDEMEKEIEMLTMHLGLPSKDEIEEWKATEGPTLLCIDDLCHEVVTNSEMVDLFTMSCHHGNISVIFITQNMFQPGKWARTINLNCHVIILFRNRRDQSQVRSLARQIMPGKSRYFMSAYAFATDRPYGYLLVDLSAASVEAYQLRTGIFPGEDTTVYAPI